MSDDEAALRFVPQQDREAAAGAIAYAAGMLAGRVPHETVAGWCYELAAMGVPYGEWPELVALRVGRSGQAGDAAAGRAVTLSQALGLIDFGEI